jgi:nucleoside 2-deoxyribosyltransferase
MKIYFAGSISGGRGDWKLYFEIINLLREYGEVLTEHIGEEALSAMGEAGLNDKEIHDRDIAWLRSADALVAEVTTASLGVGYEIGKAAEWKKPVLCLYRPGEKRRLSGMLTGSDEVKVFEYQTTGELKTAFDEFFEKR